MLITLERCQINLIVAETVMTRKFETYTFSDSKFFADRGSKYGVAEPITERIHVCIPLYAFVYDFNNLSQPHSKPIVSYYAPKGVGEHHFGVSV